MKIALFIIFFIPSLFASNLEDFCQQQNGEIFTKYKCPKSKLTLPLKTCEFRNNFDEVQFANGCTGPAGGFKDLFFDSCISHDLCYHHEPSSNGLSRKDCDEKFLNSTLEMCNTKSHDQEKCTKWATAMYYSLRVIGGPAFYCADVKAHY